MKSPQKGLFFQKIKSKFSGLLEKVLIKNDFTYKNYGIKRFIRFREGRPFLDGTIVPQKVHIEISDNLHLKKYRVRYDSNGFLMPSGKYKSPSFKIVFLGSSTTECLFMDETKRFPYLVGEILGEKAGKKINQYNAGRSGNTSYHSVNILFNKIIPMRPDIIIWMYNAFDINTLLQFDYYWPFENVVYSPLEISYSNRLLKLKQMMNSLFPNLLNTLYPIFFKNENFNKRFKKISFNLSHYTEAFKKNISIFIYICKVFGIKPLLMTEPNRLRDNPDETVVRYFNFLKQKYEYSKNIMYADYKKLNSLFNNSIIRMAKLNNIHIIDLNKLIPKNSKYIYDAFHFTEEGSKLAAELISDYLLCNKIIK